MKKSVYKILTILLVVAMLCGILPAGACLIASAEGENLVVNGDFETGDLTGGWDGKYATVTQEEKNGGLYSLKLSTGNGEWAAYDGTTVKVNVESNKTYQLTYDIYSQNTADWQAQLIIKDMNGGDLVASGNDTFPSSVPAKKWTTYSTSFNSGNNTSVTLQFCAGAAGNVKYLDNVKLIEIKDPSYDGYITNGDFETGDTTGWTLSGTSAINTTAAYGGSGYGLYVKGDSGWSGHGDTNAFAVKAGVEYTLTFDAKVITGAMYVFFKKCDANGKNAADMISGGKYYSANNRWTAYSETFTVSDGVEYMYLEFSGAGSGEVYFDNVSLEKVGGNDPVPDTILTGGQTSVSDGTTTNKGLAFRFEVKASGAVVNDQHVYQTGSATVTPFLDVEGDYALVRAGALMTNNAAVGMDENAFDLDSVDNKSVLDIEAVYLCEVNSDSFAYAVRIINIPNNGLDTNIYARPYYIYEAGDEEVIVYGSVMFNNYNYAANSDMTLTSNAISLGIRTDMLDKALVSKGNQARLANVMNRAKNGEDITVAFIGGSVTEGAYASDYKTKSYAGLTKAWWADTFPQADVTYVNAGIGGTSSLFGVHRVEQDVLSYDPDFVVIEFGVNDVIDELQAEAYASLVRRVLSYESQPAVMLLFVMNEGGNNAQADQAPIGLYYDLPMISYRDAVWPEVKTDQNPNGQYEWEDICADWVHPTDKGHAMVAELLCAYLRKTYENLSSISTSVPALPSPERPYSFENATWYNSTNTTPESMGSFSVTSQNNASWKSNGNQPIVITFTGKRVILPIPSDYASNLDVSIRIDGGASFKLGEAVFSGGRYANFLVFDEDTVGEHTIEITCNSGTLYLGGLFVS